MPPESPDTRATVLQARQLIDRGDYSGARALLDECITDGNADVSVFMCLAHVATLQNDMSTKGHAIDRALELSPRDVLALIAKGDHLSALSDARAASVFYSAALQLAPDDEDLQPRMREMLARVRMANVQLVGELEDHVRARLDSEGMIGRGAPGRFRRAVDIMFQRRRAYQQQPRFFYYPELPNVQFYERKALPWLQAVEEYAARIRTELTALIGPDFRPYVASSPDRPRNEQGGLTDNLDWSALFLVKDGRAQAHAARCPGVMQAISAAPLCEIPNRAPMALFSKLAGRAHIPPHTGMLNTRLICHLPLVVPDGCDFRVGNEIRAWREGRAWVFDDSIEHEAWNRSAVDRYILIFDVWRPELNEDERVCIAALVGAVDEFQGGVAWDGG